MPQIYSGTGVLKFTCAAITKSAGTILLKMSKAVSALTNEKITVQIQRVNGQNVYAATKVPLKEFILAHLCVENNIVNAGFGDGNFVVIELGLEAGIKLQDGEKIILDFEGIIAGDTYSVSYVESPLSTLSYSDFENKVVLSEEIDKTFDVSEFQVSVFKHAALTELGITIEGSDERRYTVEELRCLQVEDNPIFSIDAAGVVKQIDADYLTLPLQMVSKLRFYKASGTSISLTLLKYNELVPATSGKTRLLTKTK
jgi:hypothetical protein